MAGVKWLDKPRKKGIATFLEYFYSGRKWRPLLGYNLDESEKLSRALKAAQAIVDAVKNGRLGHGTPASADRVPTIQQAAERLYYPALKRKERRDQLRPRQCVAKIVEYFHGSVDTIDLEDVHNYIDQRLEEGEAAPGTVRREVGVLSRILSLCVRHKIIASNACDGVELPEDVKRERVLTGEELRLMREEASRELWAVILLALTIGLRKSLLLSIEREWIRKSKDGHRWLHLPTSATKLKGNPEATPLCALALAAINAVPNLRGKVFRRWKQQRAFSQSFERLIARCHKRRPDLFGDLRFHDTRHWFSTTLKGLGISYEVRQALMGHKIKSTTERYSHHSPEFAALMLDATQRLNAYLQHVLGATDTGDTASVCQL